ncbi:hypothetical protein B7495_12145 [Cryobacterium sp. LW097]|uniref:DUF2834 domain-containing protein n=1 Tax=unclassified Cryobacterium TaxID=2649013 RepID=UPI000B4CB96B|nr:MULTISPECIES: DUF2834 domain-containing protein [unclassified Cryobacterium]ASD24063.1 hypothetical protein B7495_12145 [Cryobacterium sp. LW097]TFC57686.1 DUF2834 domain-containing protein [Cryobacterium sp. TMB1-7]TFC88957.1 DUF2834 domain-containing protein [Cryobacterium sp. TMT4-31]
MSRTPSEPAAQPASSSAAAGWTTLTFVYLALAIVGLIGTWTWNIQAIMQASDFIGDWTMSGPAVSSLTTDLLVAAIAGSVFIIVEARRLGMRAGWAYVVFGLITAFAFTFPLFLAMRQRRLVMTT